MWVEQRLDELGLVLPGQVQLPPGVDIPFQWVRVHGSRAFVSGHGALTPEGRPSGPFGKVPSDVSLDAARTSAQQATLAILSSLKAILGDLDRVVAWTMLNGYVNADPGSTQTALVMNASSELILALFGPDVGDHARTAIGVSALPLNLPVVIAAEVVIA